MFKHKSFQFLILITFFYISPALCQNIRISELSIDEAGSEITAIDTLQETCSDNSSEPFTLAFFKVVVTNPSDYFINVSKSYFLVPHYTGVGTKRLKSKKFALASSGEISPISSATLNAIFTENHLSEKRFAGESIAIQDIGFRNITLVLEGKTSSGKKIKLRKKFL